MDRGVTELRKVFTHETSPGSLEIRVQAHDERSGVKTIKARILDGSSEVYSREYLPKPPAWRWWPDQEFAQFNWSVAYTVPEEVRARLRKTRKEPQAKKNGSMSAASKGRGSREDSPSSTMLPDFYDTHGKRRAQDLIKQGFGAI